ncbi:MAG: hypothetical protein AB1941_03910 [Gemmatimonadota bacterium]
MRRTSHSALRFASVLLLAGAAACADASLTEPAGSRDGTRASTGMSVGYGSDVSWSGGAFRISAYSEAFSGVGHFSVEGTYKVYAECGTTVYYNGDLGSDYSSGSGKVEVLEYFGWPLTENFTKMKVSVSGTHYFAPYPQISGGTYYYSSDSLCHTY